MPQVGIRNNQMVFGGEGIPKHQESISSLKKACNASLYLPLQFEYRGQGCKCLSARGSFLHAEINEHQYNTYFNGAKMSGNVTNICNNISPRKAGIHW
jgi:hypothetical protein